MKKTRGLGFVYQPTWKDKKTGETRTAPIWWACYSISGRRVRESTGTENHADAIKFLKRQNGRASIGLPVGPQLEKLTLDDLLSMVAAEYAANGRKSLGRTKIAGARLRDYFGGVRKAHEITSAEITAYQAYRLDQLWRGRPIKPATVNYEVCVLQHGLTLAERSGKLAKRPYFAMLHVSNARRGFFEREELEAILRHLPEYLRPAILCAYLTGWRMRSELLTRQWRHVDLDNGWLRLEPGEGKTGQGRAFPFSAYPELRDLLLAQRARATEIERERGCIIPWVFFYDDGSPVLNYDYAWHAARLAAGLPGRLVHDLRRTAVRNLERAGVSRSAAMRLTGHATEAVYRRYAIVDSTMLEEAVAKRANWQAGEKQSKAKVTAIIGRRGSEIL